MQMLEYAWTKEASQACEAGMGVSIGSKLILHASLQPATADGIANLLSLLRHTFGCGCANSVRSSAEFPEACSFLPSIDVR